VIPTGNLSTPNYPDSQSFFMQGGTLPSGYLNASWAGITPRVRGLTMQWFSGQRIPDLPRVCGPNCRYKVHIPSFVFKCIPNPSSLPYGQAGNPMLDFNTFGNGTTEPIRLNPSHSLWNGTTDPNSKWGFYISWSSEARYGVGTSGNASCSPFQAKYDVEVLKNCLVY
jgi:hypothetical protein